MLVVEAPPQLPQISCGLGTLEQAAGDKSKPSSRKVCFSFAAYAKNVLNHMKKCHIPIAEGLTDEEFSNIESTFGFTFPPDLEAILQEGLPVGEGFPHWRDRSHAEMRSWLDLPIKALCSEVKCGRFWPSEWGVRPDKAAHAVQKATNELKRVPTLVPVYSNCYISCFPVQAGNPVFLVQESTVLYCGYDLADFFKRQAFVPRSSSTGESPVFNLHSGLSLIKEQIKLQRNAVGGTNYGTKAIHGDYEGPGYNDDIKMSLSMAVWRWADESPRIPIDTLHREANGNHCYQHVKGGVSSLVTTPPIPPTISPCLSPSSSSPSSPLSRKNFPFRRNHVKSSSSSSASSSPSSGNGNDDQNLPFACNHVKSSSSSSASSSPSSGNGNDDQRVGIICKKYLYFHERPLPSRMLNKFTMAAPPWAAKQARKITFWSNVAEGYWLQPESSSDPATPRTPRRLQADFEFENAQQHEYFGTERKLDSIQSKYGHSADESGDKFDLELNSIKDQHDYVIHNIQPAKRSRSNHPVVEWRCSDAVTSPHYLIYKDDRTLSDLPAPNNPYTELNGKHPGMAMNNFADSCRNNSYAWLSAYLSGLADALRRGRWCEADINDMLLQYTPEKANVASPNVHE